MGHGSAEDGKKVDNGAIVAGVEDIGKEVVAGEGARATATIGERSSRGVWTAAMEEEAVAVGWAGAVGAVGAS